VLHACRKQAHLAHDDGRTEGGRCLQKATHLAHDDGCSKGGRCLQKATHLVHDDGRTEGGTTRQQLKRERRRYIVRDVGHTQVEVGELSFHKVTVNVCVCVCACV